MKLIFENLWMKIYDNVLTTDYCNLIIANSNEKMFKQELYGGNNESSKEYFSREYRTSNQHFIDRDEDVCKNLNNITAKLTGIPVINQEHAAIVRYEEGQEYKPHYDFFDPTIAHYDKTIENGGNRIVTVLFYLNDDYQGGQTVFTESQTKIEPKMGRCIVWANMLNIENFGEKNYVFNYDSKHAGIPVTSGVKWVAMKWIRQSGWDIKEESDNDEPG